MKKSLLLLALVAPVLAGCGVVARVATDAALKTLAPGLASSGSGADLAYVAGLKPLQSSDGLIVFEPQFAPAAAKWANLGAGASRYLQVHVAGQGELGKTPLWGAIEDARDRFKFADLRLDASQARPLARVTGATRVAIGGLSGNDARLTLKYQLIDVASGRVLATLQTAAAPAQLPSQLPLLARQMSAKLGIASPVLPSRVALSDEEFAFLGAQKWKLHYGDKIAPAVQARIRSLAPREAMAGVLAQRLTNYQDNASWQTLADDLLRQAPANALVAGEIGGSGASRWGKHSAKLDALLQKFPRNYLLSTAKMTLERSRKSRGSEIRWAETAARANSQSALPWIELSWAHFNSATDIRGSRYGSQISGAQWARLNTMYPKAHGAALHATQVDAQSDYAWSHLSRTAAFNGDRSTSQSAIWKSLAINPANQDAYDWGLQGCQPKWGGNAATVAKMAGFAAANADKATIATQAISAAYSETNQRAALRPILQTIIAKDPQNADALCELGTFFHHDDRAYATAEKLYRRALAAQPKHARTSSFLGDLMFFVHSDAKGAEALYRQAIAGDPTDGYYHANLGRCLALSGRKPEGIAEANLAKRYGFIDQASHPVWAATGVNP